MEEATLALSSVSLVPALEEAPRRFLRPDLITIPGGLGPSAAGAVVLAVPLVGWFEVALPLSSLAAEADALDLDFAMVDMPGRDDGRVFFFVRVAWALFIRGACVAGAGDESSSSKKRMVSTDATIIYLGKGEGQRSEVSIFLTCLRSQKIYNLPLQSILRK